MTTIPPKRRTTLYQDPFLKVEEREFDIDGRAYRYFIKDEPEFSVCAALTDDHQIIMVRQFRPGPGKYLYDHPGGMIDPGDTPEKTATKELLEETGYQAGKVIKLNSCYVTAYTTAKKHVFLATGCTKVAEPEAEENIISELVIVSPSEFRKHMNSGDILDLECYLYLDQYLKDQGL